MPRKKNRRRERRHVLDVKLSSNQLRRRRAQRAMSALFAIGFLVVTVYGLWRGGWWAVQRFVYKNDQLQIREFVVRTDGVIREDALRRWAGVATNDNLFAIDLHAIKRQLETHGMVRQAALERVLPGTLRLRVTERVPLARVRLLFSGPDGTFQSRAFGLDVAGYVLPLDQRIVRTETVKLWATLPEITGLHQREIMPGNTLTNQPALAALQFLAAFNASPMRGLVRLGTIDLAEPEVLRLATVQGHAVEVLDRGFDRQLARWELLHRTCESNRWQYSWLDLSPTNNVPVRLAPLAALTTPTPNPLH